MSRMAIHVSQGQREQQAEASRAGMSIVCRDARDSAQQTAMV